MNNNEKLLLGLMCCQYHKRPEKKCHICPYNDKGHINCLQELLWDALCYTVGCESKAELLKGIPDINDIQIGDKV